MSKVYIVYCHFYELSYDDRTWIDAVYENEELAKEHVKMVKEKWEKTEGDKTGTFGMMKLEYDEHRVSMENKFEETSVYYEGIDVLDKVKHSDLEDNF